MMNGWYQLQSASPESRGAEPALTSTERFYSQMKSIHARAALGGPPAEAEPAGAPAQEEAAAVPVSGPPAAAGPASPGEEPAEALKEQAAAGEASPAQGGETAYRPPTQHELERAFSQRQRTPPAPASSGRETALHSLTAGTCGPVLLQDSALHESLASFLYEGGSGRAVFAKGFGALGYFLTEHSMKEYTTLSFLQEPGRRIPAAARFSLATGGKGAADCRRDLRGLAMKLYADDGNFDLLCSHIPVFPVRDALRFPAFIRSLGPDPVSGLHSPLRFWEFASENPEATHFITWLYSDEGTLRSFRQMRACSVSAYIWVNGQGERRYVKYHLLPAQGDSCLPRQEAVRLSGEDPDAAGRELSETLSAGKPAEYALMVQLMEMKDRASLPYDPLDATKTWDEQQYPLLPVGRLVLDRNPADYRQQVENLAFSPLGLLPGAELSEDRLLQGSAPLYWDAQRLRLGPDFRALPVNCRRNRAPWSPGQAVTSGLGQPLCGEAVRSAPEKPEDFAQAGERCRALSETGRAHLAENIARELRLARPDVQAALIGYFSAADSGFAEELARQLRLPAHT